MESSTTTKPMRADARRNRDKLVAAALALFTAKGTDVALEAVAQQAGVGVGTLYRHFPTREALIEAVYLNELDRLHEGAAELRPRIPPMRRSSAGWTCSSSTRSRSEAWRAPSARSSNRAATSTRMRA